MITMVRIKDIIDEVDKNKDPKVITPTIPLIIPNAKYPQRSNKYKLPALYIDENGKVEFINGKDAEGYAFSFSNNGKYRRGKYDRYNITNIESFRKIIEYVMMTDKDKDFIKCSMTVDRKDGTSNEYHTNTRYFKGKGIEDFLDTDYNINDAGITLDIHIYHDKSYIVEKLHDIFNIIGDTEDYYEVTLEDIDDYNNYVDELVSNDFRLQQGVVNHNGTKYFKVGDSEKIYNMYNLFDKLDMLYTKESGKDHIRMNDIKRSNFSFEFNTKVSGSINDLYKVDKKFSEKVSDILTKSGISINGKISRSPQRISGTVTGTVDFKDMETIETVIIDSICDEIGYIEDDDNNIERYIMESMLTV